MQSYVTYLILRNTPVCLCNIIPSAIQRSFVYCFTLEFFCFMELKMAVSHVCSQIHKQYNSVPEIRFCYGQLLNSQRFPVACVFCCKWFIDLSNIVYTARKQALIVNDDQLRKIYQKRYFLILCQINQIVSVASVPPYVIHPCQKKNSILTLI